MYLMTVMYLITGKNGYLKISSKFIAFVDSFLLIELAELKKM